MDNFDKPIMDGSDNEFSNLEGDDLDETEEDAVDSIPDPKVNLSSASLSSSSSPGSVDSAVLDPGIPGSGSDVPGSGSSGSPGAAGPSSSIWMITAKYIPIQPFTSPTGPVEDMSLPIDVFDLYLSPDVCVAVTGKKCTLFRKSIIEENAKLGVIFTFFGTLRY